MIFLAHPGQPIAPHDLWMAWNLSAPLLPLLAFVMWLYARGLRRTWTRAGQGRIVPRWRIYAFYVGIGVLFVALLSPLDALGEVLFSAHMVQHMLLINVAAPLLLLGAAPLVMLRALPRSVAKSLGKASGWLHPGWRTLQHPVVAWLVFVSIFWVWHLPSLYEVALSNELVHETEHVMMLLAGMLFWWVVLKPTRRPSLHHGRNVIYLFLAMLQGTGLGVLIVFSRQPWYAAYVARAPLWGVDPLIDQQLAGIVMWLPGGALYTAMALYAMGRWLHAFEMRDRVRSVS